MKPKPITRTIPSADGDATPDGHRLSAGFTSPTGEGMATPAGLGLTAQANNPNTMISINDLVLIFASKKFRAGWRKLVGCVFRGYQFEKLSDKGWCIRLDELQIPPPPPSKKRKDLHACYRGWYKKDQNGVCNEFLRIKKALSTIFPS